MRRTNTAVWIEKYNRWQIKVQKDNIRKTFYSSTQGKTGQREAHAKADAWLEYNIVSAKKKVSQTAEEYIGQLKLTTSIAHWGQYESFFRNWINPKIGNVRVENVNEQQLQSIINEAYSKGKASKTLKGIRACIQSWLKFCRKSKYTTLFVEELTIPKGAKSKAKQILKPNDLDVLFRNDFTIYRGTEIPDIFVNAYRFAVLTGMRPGELIELKQADIVDGVVHIKRSRNVHGEITTGKNENANRIFNLTEKAAAVLEEHCKMLKAENIESDYIFPTKHGEPALERYYYTRWKKYRDYNGITAVTPYQMRHTFVSVVKSLPEGYLKPIIGHSKNMDTYGVYSHELEGDRRQTAAMIQELFNNII